MTNAILVRTDDHLKSRFEKQAKTQGVSMAFLIRKFMESYADDPHIMETSVSDEYLDGVWKSARTRDSMDALSETLARK